MDNTTFSYIVGILILGFIIYFFMSTKKETLANIDLSSPPSDNPELKNIVKSKLSNQDDLADVLTSLALRINRLETTVVNVNKDLEDFRLRVSQNAVTKPELEQTKNDIAKIRRSLFIMRDGLNNSTK